MEIVANRVALPDWTPPVLLAAIMVSISGVTYSLGGPSSAWLSFAYAGHSIVVVLIATLLWVFVRVLILARQRAPSPLAAVWSDLKPKLPMLAFPATVLPVFLGAFTAAKIAMPGLVGFRYDALFTLMDQAIFGTDPWRLFRQVIGSSASPLIEFLYIPVWAGVLAYSKALVALFCDRRTALTFFTAMMMTWLVGGFAMAYLLSSAGPLFVTYNGLETHFAELQLALIGSGFLSGSMYLQDGMMTGDAYFGGGISAMPSMHIGACAVYCFAARGTRWFYPALAFAVLIFVGSVYSGYHYAVDAIPAVVVAGLSWRAASAIHQPTRRYITDPRA